VTFGKEEVKKILDTTVTLESLREYRRKDNPKNWLFQSICEQFKRFFKTLVGDWELKK